MEHTFWRTLRLKEITVNDNNVTLYNQANIKLLQSNQSIVHHGIVTEEHFTTTASTVVNVLVTLISAFIIYFLTKKLSQEKRSSNQKENQDEETDPTSCAVSYPANEDDVSILSRLTYNWVQPLLMKDSKTTSLSSEDMFKMPNSLNVKKVQEEFSKKLKPGVNIGMKTDKKNPTLLSALYKAYGLEYFLLCGLLELVAHLINFTGPISLGLLLSFFENGDEPSHTGYRYAFLLFLSSFGKALLDSKFHFTRMHVFFKVRISIMTAIYKKALRISTVSLSKFSTGEIVNFLGTDTDRMMGFCHCFHALWSLPFETIICMYILYQLVGIAMLGGLVVALILVPINKIISTKQIALGKVLMEQKDKRTKLMNEVLGGIKIIKLYTWEDHFQKMINELRDAELQIIKRRKVIGAITGYLWTLTPIFMTVLTFSSYSMMGNTLSASKMFASLALFLKLLGSLNHLPWVFNGIMEAVISLGRIEKFVALEDIDLDAYYETMKESRKCDSVISVNTGRFTWEGEKVDNTDSNENEIKLKCESGETTSKSGTLCLRDITVDITQGQFIGVIGKVGSGKSSFLNAILAEMARKEGEISVSNLKNGFALADQEPWIQQASVRDNIIFGSPYNAGKYAEVVDAASLKKDIEMLPAGDKTEVGENGVTLSGGQKARLALARALYQDKDVYLLDDPLAAVDAHVAQQMYDKCIMGLLKHKTRILCTHHTQFLGEADLVIAMDDGIISKMGPPNEILPDVKFAGRKSSDEENEDVTDNDSNEKDGKLGDETKETGEVKLGVYKAYLTALGKWLALAMIMTVVCMQVSELMKDWWLTHWVSSSKLDDTNTSDSGYLCFHDNMSSPRSFDQRFDSVPQETSRQSSLLYYMVVYACLSAVYALFSLAREILFAYSGMSVAKTIHSNLLNTILKAPMSFYDVTPVGRILNRFSSDMGTIDDSISHMVMVVLSQVFEVVGTIAMVCYGMPWFIVLLLPLGTIYYRLQERYRHTSREVRRISSLNRSPIFSHFSETVSGLVTIRAFRESERFTDQHINHIDNWLKTHYTAHNIGMWLWLRTQLVGIVMVTGIATMAVIQHNFYGIDPGVVGLAISYILSLSGLLNGMVNCVTETEKQMVSVERVYQYIEDTPSEKWDGTQPSPSWPAAGVLSYSDVFMKYREGLPNVLKGLTFTTRHAEKIGIVGRTGSGKSSLFQTLFRTVEINSGDITIDGVNIQQLELKDVRRHLAVIPQDPFLFSGTVRENLDPTSCYSDEELWGVLDRCHLRLPVDRLGGLKGEVGEKGRHFSVGQKQLMCLARALLTKAKVLCIDEATASVDLETDKLIQETIRQEFVESTVLTIAHRINTIMDSDRVLVMDQGQVSELDSPENLLKNPQSEFYQLVHGKPSE
ncbi:ATP-binding cassette sub-family C member 10-like [Ylistrum balloti]|uniref:ATP-binding cassette sub-family C member 10-like n=1 Tax=Ylistrum balloti TaxID=509963 RepID=UPI002905B66B|nr:ATP-binding cassette sub-family C member 10-like [Ylistrum balloti]